MTLPEDVEEHLRVLGRRARARRAEHPDEWEAVARGERSVEELAAARAAAGDSAEEIERAKALFRPFDEAEEEGLVDALLERVGREDAAPGNDGGAKVLVLRAPAPTETAQGRTNRRWVWAGAAAAAAAVLVGWWLAPGPSGRRGADVDDEVVVAADHGGEYLAMAPLPAYGLQLDGGLSAMRGDTGDSSELRAYRGDTSFVWTIRPEVRVEGEVEVRVYAQGEGGLRSLPTKDVLELDQSGSVRLSGRIAALGLAPGDWTIVFVVGRPSALPRDPQQAVASRGGEGWQVLRAGIVIEE